MESRMRVLRIQRGFSLKEVSTEVGITAGYLSQIESGKRQVSAQISKKIACFFDVPSEDLFKATRYEAIGE